MGYTALYRKFRPDNFDEVKGQSHVVTPLRNQILSQRIGHAYLFCGTRGTGKTSIAKIFAKAVNCEHPVNGNPCGECENCRAIAANKAMNVIEMDAASNNGVEDVRQIKEEVAYPPSEGKYKVYIIDEVHMLSQAAFNALLKTLEEPPAYVIFILATTEYAKVPVTILSRCQRYDFHRISREEIVERLADLLEREQVEADDKALEYIARKADGGMRDALSLADQCISFYMGEKLTYERVLDVLGAVDTEDQSRLLRKIIAGDVAGAISQLDDLLSKGRDISQLINDFTWYLRNLMLYKASEDVAEVLDLSADNLALLKEEAELISEEKVVRYISILSELSNRMRGTVNRRVLAETSIVRMCRPQMDKDTVSVLERVRELEKKLSDVNFLAAAAASAGVSAPAGGEGGAAAPAAQMRAEAAPAPQVYDKPVPADLQQISKRWKEIIAAVASPLTRKVYESAEIKFDAKNGTEDVIFVVAKRVFAGAVTNNAEEKEANEKELENLIEDRIGKRIHVRIVKGEEEQGIGTGLQAINVDDAISKINAEIEMDDMEEDSDF